MIIAEINTLNIGSTGRIMFDLAESAREEGHVVYTFSAKTFRRRSKNEYKQIPFHMYYGTEFENFIHKVLGELTGLNGCFSYFATKQLIDQLRNKKVEVLHLHNLHEFCINLPLLFKYIKKEKIRVIWTLHDCWSFTGHCPHFLIADCSRWTHGCGKCPQKEVYPKSYIDSTHYMWRKKKKWFTGVEDLTIVTPSDWLARLVKESFLSNYTVKVINNGIDLNIFKPTPSDFRKNHNITNL